MVVSDQKATEPVGRWPSEVGAGGLHRHLLGGNALLGSRRFEQLFNIGALLRRLAVVFLAPAFHLISGHRRGCVAEAAAHIREHFGHGFVVKGGTERGHHAEELGVFLHDAGEDDGGHQLAVAVIDELGACERRCHRHRGIRKHAFAVGTMAGHAGGERNGLRCLSGGVETCDGGEADQGEDGVFHGERMVEASDDGAG